MNISLKKSLTIGILLCFLGLIAGYYIGYAQRNIETHHAENQKLLNTPPLQNTTSKEKEKTYEDRLREIASENIDCSLYQETLSYKHYKDLVGSFDTVSELQSKYNEFKNLGKKNEEVFNHNMKAYICWQEGFFDAILFFGRFPNELDLKSE